MSSPSDRMRTNNLTLFQHANIPSFYFHIQYACLPQTIHLLTQHITDMEENYYAMRVHKSHILTLATLKINPGKIAIALRSRSKIAVEAVGKIAVKAVAVETRFLTICVCVLRNCVWQIRDPKLRLRFQNGLGFF
ncbi:unnamed protein product [Microthlaspi erraticum]|uniref:Uncharacterized protein n=1 Tax=Microthlaspi erraticum TaxID=1685480 RepID=A0A6D2J096_9BRAS|nr:unnamed protein product [Microthlaspi erraticum]